LAPSIDGRILPIEADDQPAFTQPRHRSMPARVDEGVDRPQIERQDARPLGRAQVVVQLELVDPRSAAHWPPASGPGWAERSDLHPPRYDGQGHYIVRGKDPRGALRRRRIACPEYRRREEGDEPSTDEFRGTLIPGFDSSARISAG
jgi:hypothetical protein